MKALSLALPLLALLTMSCHEEKKSPVEERVIEEVDEATGIINLRNYELSDTITIGGKQYKYTYSLEHVDTMPVLVNPQGLEYHESRVCIKIQGDSTTIFDKTFYKNNFKQYVKKDFLQTSTMVGVNYNFTKRDEDRSAFYFIVTVGDPDETSDMAWPMELKIDTQGNYSINKAENLETEPLRPGLNVEPSDDV